MPIEAKIAMVVKIQQIIKKLGGQSAFIVWNINPDSAFEHLKQCGKIDPVELKRLLDDIVENEQPISFIISKLMMLKRYGTYNTATGT